MYVLEPNDKAIGYIQHWPKDKIPSDWLAANGKAISRYYFVKLFKKITIEYGQGDGITTFNLPDFCRHAPKDFIVCIKYR